MAGELHSYLGAALYHEFIFYAYAFVRLVTGFVFILIYFYISGRTQLSQMNTIDLMGNFILGGVIGGVIYTDQGSYIRYVGILILTVFIMVTVSYASRKFYWLRAITIGLPIAIIKNGRFLMDNINKKSNKVDMLNVVSQLNSQGIGSFEDIYFAQIEPSGIVSAISDAAKLPSTIVISRGQIYHDELKSTDKTEKALLSDMSRNGLKNIGDIYLAEYKNGRFRYITNKGEAYPKKRESQKESAHEAAARAFARQARIARLKKRGFIFPNSPAQF